ncbi:MAG: type II toxin-antitoxin system VapC family toxin [Planctomycetes bacterium]|nr:type II toxin-antitoxin system VapC family toxin [Planctomycetota bacterium]
MSLYVVDASVGIKWFLPEAGAADALRLQDAHHELHVPTLFDAEVTNVLWKRVRRGDLSRTDADDLVARLPPLPVTRHPQLPLLPTAFEFACRMDRSVYDGLYLALAKHLTGQMVTADERLVNSLAGTPLATFVLLLRDLP